jgi:hypothetical protein
MRLYIHEITKILFGGGERIRTADLPRAKRTLYQLSYIPSNCLSSINRPKLRPKPNSFGGPKSS